jgi:tellurite methyltransferase
MGAVPNRMTVPARRDPINRTDMLADRIKWNEKYHSRDYPVEPSAVVTGFCLLASGRRALDIAAGCGRNALYLAQQGFAVDAVDISDSGLALAAGRHPNIRPVCADLDTFDIPAQRYDLIVNILYLNRRLFPQVCEGLRPGGLLIFETLLAPPAGAAGGTPCRDYFLRPNELLHAFLSLRIIYYRETGAREGEEGKPLASLVAVKAPGG